MNKEDIFKILSERLKLSVIKQDEPMSKHTTFKIGGKADIFIIVNDLEELKYIMDIIHKNNIPFVILGNGSNVLVKDDGIRGIVLKINLQKVNMEYMEDYALVTVEAGVKNGELASKLQKGGLGGFEFASGIPGTIGGAIKMNAGVNDKEFKDIVVNVTYMDYNGNIKKIDKSECEFSYRHSLFFKNKYVILSTTLKLYKQDKDEIKKKIQEYLSVRKQKQPLSMPSAGSTFKRGKDFITAKLIDECGLKGYSIGDAQVSELHAGFIVNKGNATAKDVIELTEYVKKKVKEKFNKDIELEVEIIGD